MDVNRYADHSSTQLNNLLDMFLCGEILSSSSKKQVDPVNNLYMEGLWCKLLSENK